MALKKSWLHRPTNATECSTFQSGGAPAGKLNSGCDAGVTANVASLRGLTLLTLQHHLISDKSSLSSRTRRIRLTGPAANHSQSQIPRSRYLRICAILDRDFISSIPHTLQNLIGREAWSRNEALDVSPFAR